ncbi:MAG: tetratricopeptide repeat protein [Pseudomonadota bacterium]
MKSHIVIMALLLAGLLLGGCAASKRDQSFKEFAYGEEGPITLTPAQHEKVADGYLRGDKPEMAFMHYNKAITLDPDALAARVKKADLLVAKGLDEQALAEYLEVLSRDEDHAGANGAAGAVYFRAGLYDEARTHLEKAVRLNPLLWKANSYLGILNDRAGNHERAAAYYTAALDLHQGEGAAEIFNNLGVVHIARGEYDLAVDALRRALKAGSVSARTYNNLGLALVRLDRLDEALESFKYAGGDARANNNLGYVLLTDDQPEKAVPYFERAVELAPSYYVMAAENLNRARLAARFRKSAAARSMDGSTPNPLPKASFPDAGQPPHGPAATPAAAGPSLRGDVRTIAHAPASASGTEHGLGDDIKTYGLHVSSWQDHDDAFAHCATLRQKGYEPWVNRIDLGDKGVWFRVLVGSYASVAEAQAGRPEVLTALTLERATVYERAIPSAQGERL